MGATGQPPDGFPSWVRAVGAPVWISDHTGNIGYVNERAEALFGLSAAECIGRPCHEVVAGRDADGKLHCRADCPIATRAGQNAEIEPFEVRIGDSPATARWVQILIIKIGAAHRKRPWLVHCAISRDKAHRVEAYLAKVAARTGHNSFDRHDTNQQGLTAREGEILALLAKDHDLYTIAEELHISYVTVRNHVQHILTKLGVHSIMEAVACYLLLEDEDAPH